MSARAAGSTRPRLAAWGAALALLPLLGGCGPQGPRAAYPHDEGAEHAAGPLEGLHVDEPASVGAADAILGSAPVSPVSELEGVDVEPFRVTLRTPEVGHFPCTSCHIRPIGSKSVALDQMHSTRPEHEGATRIECYTCHDPTRPTGLMLECTECHEREGSRDLMPSRTAHLTVELSHPSGVYRNCLTCHAPENPGLLNLRDGSQATLDEAYRLCAGCHFMEAREWAGGAHGKRVDGWRGERTILSCTGCHDPHDPTFAKRRPVTFPKIPRRAGGR